jgi:hypothetical protein
MRLPPPPLPTAEGHASTRTNGSRLASADMRARYTRVPSRYPQLLMERVGQSWGAAAIAVVQVARTRVWVRGDQHGNSARLGSVAPRRTARVRAWAAAQTCPNALKDLRHSPTQRTSR